MFTGDPISSSVTLPQIFYEIDFHSTFLHGNGLSLEERHQGKYITFSVTNAEGNKCFLFRFQFRGTILIKRIRLLQSMH